MPHKDKCSEIITLLKSSFNSNKVITDKNFFEYSLGYDDDTEIVESLVIGKPWWKIDWQYINEQAGDAWMTPSYIKLSAYKILFPSFLLDCLTDAMGTRESLLAGYFLEWHLNLNNIEYEDKKEFMLNLSNEQKNCIALILNLLVSMFPKYHVTKEALESYWEKFL